MIKENLFHLLKETVQVLIVEDNSSSFELVENVLGTTSIYRIEWAKTASAAARRLGAKQKFHICLLDLGMSDVDGDEFFLIRRYSAEFPILVFTASDSPGKGADSVLLGAKAVIEKKTPFDTFQFLKTINYWSLISLINNEYGVKRGTTLEFATKVLLEKKPCSVTQWADQMRITDRQLRNLWATAPGFGAKSVLNLFHLYSNIFQAVEEQFIGNDLTLGENKALLQKAFEFFAAHPDQLSSMLA
ncbi:response regulator [Chitinispirillales bacterium ANBcel5]|uniref:response regulator n=1 Tax=Cellulosispirillum alkaliphilum TaxID=3039283 RepID=UPI002A51D4D8|nr:response regulator [Chitinispirillales bacterium ANBcel5]